jgi:hypothetical protein
LCVDWGDLREAIVIAWDKRRSTECAELVYGAGMAEATE